MSSSKKPTKSSRRLCKLTEEPRLVGGDASHPLAAPPTRRFSLTRAVPPKVAQGPGWCAPFSTRRCPPVVATTPSVSETLACMFAHAAQEQQTSSVPITLDVNEKLAGLFAHAAQHQQSLTPMPALPMPVLPVPVKHPPTAVCNTLAGLFAQAAQSGYPLSPMPALSGRVIDHEEHASTLEFSLSAGPASTPAPDAHRKAPSVQKQPRRKSRKPKGSSRAVESDSTYSSSDSDGFSPPLKPSTGAASWLLP